MAGKSLNLSRDWRIQPIDPIIKPILTEHFCFCGKEIDYLANSDHTNDIILRTEKMA